jgi:hypothetical protein
VTLSVTQSRALCSTKSCGTGSDDLVEHSGTKAKAWSGSRFNLRGTICSDLASARIYGLGHNAPADEHQAEGQENFSASGKSNREALEFGEQLRNKSFFVLLSCLTSNVLPMYEADFAYEKARKKRVKGIEPSFRLSNSSSFIGRTASKLR